MNRVPFVERDAVMGGLTFESASLWYAFLAEEAYWRDDMTLAQGYKRRSQELKNSPTGSLHDRRLEEAIKRWKR